MPAALFDIGSISSRGQIAIPSDIRRALGLKEGSKVLFILEDDVVMMRKVTAESFADITKPLRQAGKNIKEENVVDLVHKTRATKQ